MITVINPKILLKLSFRQVLSRNPVFYHVEGALMRQGITKEFINKSTLLMFPSFPQFLSGNPVFSLIFLDSCFRRNDQL